MRWLFLPAFCLLLSGTNLAAQKISKPAQQPIVVLTFDDAVRSHYTVVAPLLKKYGFDATFFVCDYPRKSPADSIDFMTWPQIRQLHKMGFEIGNHTGHHKNVTKLDRAQMKEEISYLEVKCRAYGIPKPVSFAYPGNRSDSLSQVVLAEMDYRYARAGGSRYYDPRQDKRLVIPSYTMASTDKLRERVLQAFQEVKPGQVLVFTIHGVPYLTNPDYSTTPAHFEEYLKYLRDHNFKVIALRNLDKYLAAGKGTKASHKEVKTAHE
jgi:peptidoglycan/xylan/chitin deacetylase (PgdA/CDA1 family)